MSRSCSTTNNELPERLELVAARRAAPRRRPDAGRPTARPARRPRRTGCERDLRGQAQPLQLAGRQRRRAAIQRQVAQAQRLQGADALEQVVRDALRGQAFFLRQVGRAAHVRRAGVREPPAATRCARCLARCVRLSVAVSRPASRLSLAAGRSTSAMRSSGSCDSSPMSQAGEGHRQRLALEPLAVAQRARRCRPCSATRASSSARSGWWRRCAARSLRAPVKVPMVAGLHLALAARRAFPAGVKPGVHRHRRAARR